ncbi:MAG: LamG domain-containing protein [Firmicutes bacterium]|jgi:hypothetical protein|nr:LamG domain-containing protein [Bacillota bacterium]
MDAGLLAHWPFEDGSSVKIEERIRLGGTEDFTIALWAKTDAILDDVLGDLAAWYDPRTRQGFNLGIMTAHGVTSHQPNYRHLYFGIDAGCKPVWRDCGRPGRAVRVMALATYEGSLYAATFETGDDERGHVYRYLGGQSWEDCGSPDACNSVASLAVYNGELYAGVTRYRAEGSSLPPSENKNPGGAIYRYAGGQEWVYCGRLPDADSVICLTVFRGQLYAIPWYSQGVFRYDGHAWRYCGTPGRRLMSLAVFAGDLYAAGNEGGGVFRYAGERAWESCGFQEGMTQIYSFVIHRGMLLIGAWPEARVFEYAGGERWIDRGRLDNELEVMGMMVYNGKLYAGTLPLAEVYRYDGPKQWSRLQQLDMTPDVRYRRVWSMAVYGGRLYCGTLPSGRVFSMEAGKCVTHDHELSPGWHHIAARRSATSLALFVDGRMVASAEDAGLRSMNIDNDAPFLIGSGPVDDFHGQLRDVRLYDRALTNEQIKALASM